jgi:glycosyltransferase involved in cell wall biosynthesis
MSDKKLLIIGEAFYPEDFIINDLAQEWSSKGYHVEVLTRNPSYPFGKIFDGYKNKIYQKTFFEEIPVHRVFVLQGYQKSKVIKILNYFSFVFFASLVAIRIGRKFDRVFVYQTGPLTVALPGNLIRILFKKKLTIWTQDLWPDTVYAYGFKKGKLFDKGLNSLVSFVYNNSDTIAVSCSGFTPKLSTFLKYEKPIQWIPNWPIIHSSALEPKVLPGRFNFTFAGNLGKVQNLENVLLAFNNISKKHPDVWINLIGDGSATSSLIALVKDHEIKNVNFVGRRPLSEMPDYFSGSDVLLISLVDSSIYEFMIPSKFQTYLNYEKPIFAIMKGEVPEMVGQYNLGINADPNNIDSIYQGFEAFLKLSKQDLDQMGSYSIGLLNSTFIREKNIEKLTKLTFEESCTL